MLWVGLIHLSECLKIKNRFFWRRNTIKTGIQIIQLKGVINSILIPGTQCIRTSGKYGARHSGSHTSNPKTRETETRGLGV
jgi:hypothetical protein